MNIDLKELMEKKNIGQLTLIVLFIIYLILPYSIPYSLAVLIDNFWGKFIVIGITLILFVKCNPILGILGFFVAYKLLMSSTYKSGNYGLQNYIPTEEKKYAQMINNNIYPYIRDEIIELR